MNNLLKKIKSLLLAFAEGWSGPHPERDWLIVLGGTFACITASLFWNAWFFNRVADIESAPVEHNGTVETYPAGAIQKLFEARKEMEEAYRSSFPFIDPSR